MSSRSGTCRGFTLLEVVVAILLVSSALVATLATYGSELRTLARAREAIVAVELAQDRLAAIELFADERLTDLPDSLARGTFAEPFGTFEWSAEATTMSGQAFAEMTIRVTWPTGARSLTTLLPLTDLRRVVP